MNHSGGGFISRLSDDTAAPIDNFFLHEEQASVDAKHQVMELTPPHPKKKMVQTKHDDEN